MLHLLMILLFWCPIALKVLKSTIEYTAFSQNFVFYFRLIQLDSIRHLDSIQLASGVSEQLLEKVLLLNILDFPLL